MLEARVRSPRAETVGVRANAPRRRTGAAQAEGRGCSKARGEAELLGLEAGPATASRRITTASRNWYRASNRQHQQPFRAEAASWPVPARPHEPPDPSFPSEDGRPSAFRPPVPKYRAARWTRMTISRRRPPCHRRPFPHKSCTRFSSFTAPACFQNSSNTSAHPTVAHPAASLN